MSQKFLLRTWQQVFRSFPTQKVQDIKEEGGGGGGGGRRRRRRRRRRGIRAMNMEIRKKNNEKAYKKL
jgi:hypothetical protein